MCVQLVSHVPRPPHVSSLEHFMNHQSDQNQESGKVGLIRMLGMHSSASLFMELMAGAR